VQKGFQIAVAGDCNAEHLALDPSVKALHHPIGFGRVGPRRAMLHGERSARRLEPVGREAGAAVGEPMGDLEGEGPDRLLQKGHGTALGFVVLDGQVDEAGGAVDRHIQGPLAALAISGAQLGQVLHVHVHEAKIVVFEGPVRLARPACGRQAAQALGLQNAVDRVAVEVGQEVGDHEGEVVQREAGRTPQRTDNGPLFFRCVPGQLMRAAGAVLAIGCTALAPLADGLGRHPIAAGQHTCGLSGAGDLGTDSRGGASVSVDRVHQRAPGV
jgi:hypothetical protein